MINRQEQNAADGSIAVQANGAVTITKNGLELAEVKELTEIFLEKHLPALRAEAEATARKHTKEFMDAFVNKLAEPNKVTAEAFAKPDSQACFSAALLSSAEKGDQIDLKLLASMVVRRLEEDSDPLMKLVYEEAISITPRLTKQHIAFLTFVFFTKHISFNNNPPPPVAERYASTFLPLMEPGFQLSTANKEYLCSKGLMSINLVADANTILEQYKKALTGFPTTDGDLQATCPSLHTIIKNYGVDSIPTCFLTASGKLVALSAMESVVGHLDMSIWIC
ncbi:LPO_1073/Vpar_1526 family protein [Pseudomonas sp. Q12-87]|uniref:LPO_1073/Vpar_1526 family protein n=1 Tax=Pseudomonas sp. Q12-87 TaxID=177989 RepID=UPI00069F0297|nr:LPO_1073/Vpar_1526 family protein [Pseudomonas sp. Q12-87]